MTQKHKRQHLRRHHGAEHRKDFVLRLRASLRIQRRCLNQLLRPATKDSIDTCCQALDALAQASSQPKAVCRSASEARSAWRVRHSASSVTRLYRLKPHLADATMRLVSNLEWIDVGRLTPAGSPASGAQPRLLCCGHSHGSHVKTWPLQYTSPDPSRRCRARDTPTIPPGCSTRTDALTCW